jgi:dolichyl-phosphate-mannose-protein mannosyltransferase
VRVIHTVIPWTIPGDDVATAAVPGVRRHPDVAAVPAAGRRPAGAGRERVLRALRAVAALLGLGAIGGYVAIALLRLGYAFPLEVLESNSLVEVHRILAGQPLYVAPTVSYVPDGYPPLYFAVSAAAASVLGQSYLVLRVVSLGSSLACFAVVARLVGRETASAPAGLAAAGLLAATYFAAGTWFDVARVDSLFLALSVAGLYTARWMRTRRAAIMTGLLLGAAFLTKQTALAEGAAVLAAVAAGPRRRLAVPAALAYAATVGASTLALGLASHGWYLYYVFEQMSEHALNAAAVGQFWAGYLLPTLGLAVVAVMLRVRRGPGVLLAGCAALVVEGYAALVHAGGGVNDLLPAYLVVALLAGLAMGDQPRGMPPARTSRVARARTAGWSGWAVGWGWYPRRVGRPAALAAVVLVVAQLAVLAAGSRPGRAIPSGADRAAGLRLAAGLRALGGTVAIPADPALAVMAGLPEIEDQFAAVDVLRASDPSAKATFTRSVARAVATRRFTMIITVIDGDLRGFPPDLPRYYHRCPQMPLLGIPPAPFRQGLAIQPVSVWLPVGRGSCAVAARALAGPLAAAASPALADAPSRSGGPR